MTYLRIGLETERFSEIFSSLERLSCCNLTQVCYPITYINSLDVMILAEKGGKRAER